MAFLLRPKSAYNDHSSSSSHPFNKPNSSTSTSPPTNKRSASSFPLSSNSRNSSYNLNNPYELVDQINRHNDLYHVLGLTAYSHQNRHLIKFHDIRRAYISRSRLCHPDKLPCYEPCTAAFQKLSFAYETLSKPSSRRLYDLNCHVDPSYFKPHCRSSSSSYHPHKSNSFKNPSDHFRSPCPEGNNPHSAEPSGVHPDETLNGVLYSTFCEFMDGDFEMIRVLINALNESNPGLNLGEDVITNLEGAFKRLRTVLLSGQKYLKLVRFELMKLYEIQSNLRALSYFNLLGRVRLSLALARVTLSIPMRIDQAMRNADDDGDDNNDDAQEGSADDDVDSEEDEQKEFTNRKETDNREEGSRRKRRDRKGGRRGILPRRVAGLLEVTVAVLERGERVTSWVTGSSSSSTSSYCTDDDDHPQSVSQPGSTSRSTSFTDHPSDSSPSTTHLAELVQDDLSDGKIPSLPGSLPSSV